MLEIGEFWSASSRFRVVSPPDVESKHELADIQQIFIIGFIVVDGWVFGVSGTV